MTDARDRVTRVAADLFEAAAAEGARSSRSAKQQLDYWARVGRAVTARETLPRRRIEAAMAGTLPMTALTDDEAVVVNAEIDAAIEKNLAGADYTATLNASGMTTVSIDADGRLIEHRLDGTTATLADSV